MKIYLALQCHNFQRRLCWMLSSILEQRRYPLSDLIIDIACMSDNGTPTTEVIAEAFRQKGLDINLNFYEEKDRDLFARRGYVRDNQTIKARLANAEYIYYTDSDIVFHPDFFYYLKKFLSTEGHTFSNCLYSRNKRNTIKDDAEALVNIHLSELPIIENAFEKAEKLPELIIAPEDRRDGGASGGMQVVHIADIDLKNKGSYTGGKKSRDRHLFKEKQLARSDVNFRAAMGGSTRVKLPLQIHLQHRRDKEVGYHIEEQR